MNLRAAGQPQSRRAGIAKPFQKTDAGSPVCRFRRYSMR